MCAHKKTECIASSHDALMLGTTPHQISLKPLKPANPVTTLSTEMTDKINKQYIIC